MTKEERNSDGFGDEEKIHCCKTCWLQSIRNRKTDKDDCGICHLRKDIHKLSVSEEDYITQVEKLEKEIKEMRESNTEMHEILEYILKAGDASPYQLDMCEAIITKAKESTKEPNPRARRTRSER